MFFCCCCFLYGFTGGTILTVSGYGFRNDTAVTIGTQPCNIIEVELFQLRCTVPVVSINIVLLVLTEPLRANSQKSCTTLNGMSFFFLNVHPHNAPLGTQS